MHLTTKSKSLILFKVPNFKNYLTKMALILHKYYVRAFFKKGLKNYEINKSS